MSWRIVWKNVQVPNWIVIALRVPTEPLFIHYNCGQLNNKYPR